jgi:hypothetical protein
MASFLSFVFNSCLRVDGVEFEFIPCRWRIGGTGFQGKCMGKATAWIAATIICPNGEEEQ